MVEAEVFTELCQMIRRDIIGGQMYVTMQSIRDELKSLLEMKGHDTVPESFRKT
jgi:hypothetical protein